MLTTINKYANVDDILFDNEVKMITKRFSKKIESKQFEKQFNNGDIETDVIFNIVHDEKKIAKNKSLQQYHHLWNSYDQPHSGLSQILQSMMIRHSNAALEHHFGKCDFVFDGNRDYKNYVLDFNGLIFIASNKPEVVLIKRVDFVDNVVEFDNAFKQLILDYMLSNNKLSLEQQKILADIEQIGLIQDGKINIAYC